MVYREDGFMKEILYPYYKVIVNVLGSDEILCTTNLLGASDGEIVKVLDHLNQQYKYGKIVRRAKDSECYSDDDICMVYSYPEKILLSIKNLDNGIYGTIGEVSNIKKYFDDCRYMCIGDLVYLTDIETGKIVAEDIIIKKDSDFVLGNNPSLKISNNGETEKYKISLKKSYEDVIPGEVYFDYKYLYK